MPKTLIFHKKHHLYSLRGGSLNEIYHLYLKSGMSHPLENLRDKQTQNFCRFFNLNENLLTPNFRATKETTNDTIRNKCIYNMSNSDFLELEEGGKI